MVSCEMECALDKWMKVAVRRKPRLMEEIYDISDGFCCGLVIHQLNELEMQVTEVNVREDLQVDFVIHPPEPRF